MPTAQIPASFKVTGDQVGPDGVIIVKYERDGDVKNGAPQIEEDDGESSTRGKQPVISYFLYERRRTNQKVY